MSKNVGTIDRVIRLIIAAAAAYLIFSHTIELESITGIIAAVVGVIMGATAIFGSCPLYSLVGLSTCPLKNK